MWWSYCPNSKNRPMQYLICTHSASSGFTFAIPDRFLLRTPGRLRVRFKAAVSGPWVRTPISLPSSVIRLFRWVLPLISLALKFGSREGAFSLQRVGRRPCLEVGLDGTRVVGRHESRVSSVRHEAEAHQPRHERDCPMAMPLCGLYVLSAAFICLAALVTITHT